jgi:hypothetical protein
MIEDAAIDNGFISFPSLQALGGDELVLIYVGQDAVGRVERTSSDAGRTWSEPRTIIADMVGVNGFMVPLLDGAGNPHLVINMRTMAKQLNGIFYAPRAGQDWEPISAAAVDERSGKSAHYADAAVRLGNEIHVVWSQARGSEIWHVSGQISGVPALEARADSSLPPRPGQAEATAAPGALPAGTATEPVAGVGPAATRPVISTSAPPPASTFPPLVIGVLPAVLAVVAAAAWSRGRWRQ